MFEIGATDKAGNILHGPAFAIDSENCLVHAEQHLTAVVGVKDLVVVTTPDAVLVLPRGRAQEVKGLVGALRALVVPRPAVTGVIIAPGAHSSRSIWASDSK